MDIMIMTNSTINRFVHTQQTVAVTANESLSNWLIID